MDKRDGKRDGLLLKFSNGLDKRDGLLLKFSNGLDKRDGLLLKFSIRRDGVLAVVFSFAEAGRHPRLSG